VLAGALTPGVALAHEAPDRAPTALDWLATWSFDLVPWAGTLLVAVAYLLAVRAVNRRHPRTAVPAWRVAAFLAGLASIVLALESSIDVYADELLTVHMLQHLLLAMVAPPLLAFGSPGTLALRVARADIRRDILLPALHSRAVRVLTSPIVAWVAFSAAMWFLHFSPLYEAALENDTLHEAEHGVFLATGILFWWPIIAADPLPNRPSWAWRLAYVALQMPVNAAVGLVIYFSPSILYPHYAALQRTWGPDAHADQQIAGILMWGAGDVLLLIAFVAVVAAWMRRELRRDARHAPAGGGSTQST
jgi:cytochrome c oxidase assembly factor CtaG